MSHCRQQNKVHRSQHGTQGLCDVVWIYSPSSFLTSTPINSLFQKYKTSQCSRNILCTFLPLHLYLHCSYDYYIPSLVFSLRKTIFKRLSSNVIFIKLSSWPLTSPSNWFFPPLWSLSYTTQITELLCTQVFSILPWSNWTQRYVLFTSVFTRPSGLVQ